MTTISPFTPALPNTPGTRFIWAGLHDASVSLAIANAATHHHGLILVIAENVQAAACLERELEFFLIGSNVEILSFPDWETLPYDIFSPLPEIISQRLLALNKLVDLQRGILVVPVATMLQRLPPRDYLEAHTLHITKGEKLQPERLYQRLEYAGYRRVSQVLAHGEFAVRGSLIDLFPMGSHGPYRIDLLDNEIDSIRAFDPDTQRSLEQTSTIKFLPAREVPLDEAGINQFRQAFRTAFEGDPQRSLVYREVSVGHAPNGIEYYLPLFYAKTNTLFDYLPDNTLVIYWEKTKDALEDFLKQVAERYEQRRYDIERPLLAPVHLYLNISEFNSLIKHVPTVQINSELLTERPRGFAAFYNFATAPLPPLDIQSRATDPAATLRDFITQQPTQILFLAESPGRREHMLANLRDLKFSPQLLSNWLDFLTTSVPIAMTVAPLERGLLLMPTLGQPRIALLPENVLYGERVLQERRRKAQIGSDQVIRNLTELNLGDPVVHEKHGIGRYLGLQTLTVGGIETELLMLEYARGDKLYVPVSALHLISRYTGAAAENAPLHRLGSDQWEKIKNKAAAQVRDVAAELLEIHARRAANIGIASPPAGDEYATFAAAFQFEATPDQQQAIDAVLVDLASPHPMDRVVCGDVGFGKTEVAMRAAFQAIQGERQVAVVVPTTLLAEQHYANFSDRFADWPVRIESISRFRTPKEQKTIIADLADGRIDIIIGTHKLLQPEIKFNNLGLVIIDEEHRFGVRHKERLKSLRIEVDLLTLTATPIPRTLNMALAGMRDLSIIATPPTGRHPVKTFVNQWNDELIIEACQREIKRGGQVYFLHNEVQTIESTAKRLQALLPNIRCEIAHGQMRERDLERVMRDFYHQRFNLLVCSTIIESGIDIPSANTIIIDRADKLGLAQLHQLRGRVGRSHHRAYAYLITPPSNVMTEDAKKRLAAIESMEDLGAGFTLATHDLEIRGAGELLGEEQSGQMQEVGFTMYMELLERAVQDLKSGRRTELTTRSLQETTEIELHLSALLPADYIPDVHTRLVLYKRIASATSTDGLWELQVELIDRFGLLPLQAKNLFAITELKLASAALGIRKIEAGPTGGRITFSSSTPINPVQIVKLVQHQPKEFRIESGDILRFTSGTTTPENRIGQVYKILQKLRE